jgi:hypothetical protein
MGAGASLNEASVKLITEDSTKLRQVAVFADVRNIKTVPCKFQSEELHSQRA